MIIDAPTTPSPVQPAAPNPPGPAPIAPTPVPAPVPVTQPPEEPRPEPPKVAAPDPRFPKASKRSGFLTVEGQTSQSVVIDGKRVGGAPIKRYPLEPGRHDVVINVPKGKPKHFKVRITTGKEVLVRVP